MKYISTKDMYLQVIPTPQYLEVGEGEVVARANRTGMMFIIRETGRMMLRSGRPAVDVYGIDTVVRRIDGRPSVIGVRGPRICAGQA